MNLLMILLIILAIWVGVAICLFAWRVMPDVPEPPVDQPLSQDGSKAPGPDPDT